MRMRTAITGLLLSSVCFGAEAPPRPYPCYRPSVAPVIDGEVAGDPAWQAIPSVTGFRVLGNGYTEAKQTTAQACWDDEAFYVAMVCEEPDAAQLKPVTRDGGPTWLEDSVEIFLQPKPPGQVYQFGVTAGGAKGGFEGNPDIWRCQAAAKTGADSYSLELRIPFAVISGRAAAGDRWLGTFCRNIFTITSGGDKFTNWAPLQARFLEPEHFLPIVLMAETPDAASAAKMTEQLNAAYRATLIARLRAAAAAGRKYTGDLIGASKDARFADQTRDLLRQWQEIDRLSSQAREASLPDIRRAIRTVTALARSSYEVKYEYLITRLLDGE